MREIAGQERWSQVESNPGRMNRVLVTAQTLARRTMVAMRGVVMKWVETVMAKRRAATNQALRPVVRTEGHR